MRLAVELGKTVESTVVARQRGDVCVSQVDRGWT